MFLAFKLLELRELRLTLEAQTEVTLLVKEELGAGQLVLQGSDLIVLSLAFPFNLMPILLASFQRLEPLLPLTPLLIESLYPLTVVF